MDTLTVTLNSGKLSFGRRAFLGGTYAVAFAGEAAGKTGLTLYITGRGGRTALAQSATADGSTSIAFNTDELIREFRGCGGESIAFSAWLADATGTLGAGRCTVEWSPLVVDIETGHAASLKGDTGTGIATIARGTGTTAVVTLTDGTTQTLDLSGLKGDKGDSGSSVGSAAAALINALASGEPANLDTIYTDIAAIKAALKALQQ